VGGLSALIITLLACDRKNADPEPGGRAVSVLASEDASPPASRSAAATPTTPPEPPRKLCEKELTQAGRRLPKVTFTPVAAPGVPLPGSTIATDRGRWTWINFFAAWCGPCKEEMPRLKTFEDRLARNLEVAFVSLDDDERQLRQLLAGTPDAAPAVRSALWLEPGKGRAEWLKGLHMKESPDLPAHVLVDPSGKVRCVVGGAVTDADFANIAAIVKR
jgi:thiol-disulfide isomerase/thioredoxin